MRRRIRIGIRVDTNTDKGRMRFHRSRTPDTALHTVAMNGIYRLCRRHCRNMSISISISFVTNTVTVTREGWIARRRSLLEVNVAQWRWWEWPMALVVVVVDIVVIVAVLVLIVMDVLARLRQSCSVAAILIVILTLTRIIR